MKNNKSFPIVHLCPLFILLMFLACHEKPRVIQQIEISDVTDSLIVRPDPKLNISQFDLAHDKYKECRFKRVFISDKQLNPSVELTLEGCQSHFNRKPYERELQIIQFYKDIQDVMKKDSAETVLHPTRDYSECFRTIADEVTEASKRRAYQNFIIIHSNLFENSSICNLYDPSVRRKILSNPTFLLDLFEKQQMLPKSLRSFYILFVYETENRDNDELYKMVSGTYKHILESRGAVVKISSSNSKQLFYESQ